MSDGRSAAGPATRVGSGAGRLIRAWRVMPRERRLAAYAALGLFVTMFLPWYQRQFFVVVGGRIAPGSDSQTAWAQFSFVEAAVLLVAVGVLTLLFQRAEGKAFHLPGGDGWVITAAGCWTCVLIIWRIFDKQGGNAHGQNATTYGIEWGIFVALGVAAVLAYAGSRIRAAHRPEPPLPGDDAAAVQTEVQSQPPPPRPSRRERRERREVGWLTAPPRETPPRPSHREQERKRSADWRPPEWSGDEPREWSSPKKPLPPDDAPTIRRNDPPIPPSTPAARRGQDPDDQMTIPLERDE
jgi:hypothetical protein